MSELSEKNWYQFNYHNGNRVTTHQTTTSFVERVRVVAQKRGWDVVITRTDGNG